VADNVAATTLQPISTVERFTLAGPASCRHWVQKCRLQRSHYSLEGTSPTRQSADRRSQPQPFSELAYKREYDEGDDAENSIPTESSEMRSDPRHRRQRSIEVADQLRATRPTTAPPPPPHTGKPEGDPQRTPKTKKTEHLTGVRVSRMSRDITPTQGQQSNRRPPAEISEPRPAPLGSRDESDDRRLQQPGVETRFRSVDTGRSSCPLAPSQSGTLE